MSYAAEEFSEPHAGIDNNRNRAHFEKSKYSKDQVNPGLEQDKAFVATYYTFILE